MERGQSKRPTAILTGDWHLREDQPVCRTDNFEESQWKKVDFISDLQNKYECIVLHSGDLYHHWKPTPYLLAQTMKHLPDRFYTVLGNHDLPQHSLELIDKCGVNVLRESGKLTLLDTCHFGQEPTTNSFYINGKYKTYDILVWHHLTYLTPPYPGATGGNAETILNKYNNFDLIVTGDCHQNFTIEKNGRRLINPGNLTRQTADQIDYKPSVYLWYAEDNSVKQVFLPIEEGVVSREHLVKQEERDNRIDAFVEKLNSEYTTSVSFEENLSQFLKVNNIDKTVEEIIYKCIE
jgi:DNA repair exonuclease SbcCD nuclease subunit